MAETTVRHPWPGQMLDRIFAGELGHPDLGRGLRCMISYMAPLALGLSGRLPVEMIYAAIAAQNIANVDIRGAYGLRLSLLLAMSVILAGAAALGALAGHPIGLCLAAAALVALGAGLWRHLSSDYGPSLATASSLLAFIAMVEPGGAHAAANHALAALVGGCWGVALHVALWPIRPQHPLRQAVSNAWTAVAGLCVPAADSTAEAGFRTELDRATAILEGLGGKRKRPLVARLEELNRTAARLAQGIAALQAAREELAAQPGQEDARTAAEVIFSVLGNLSRTVALAVVSRQPGHLAAAEVRARRLRHLLEVLKNRTAAQGGDAVWTAAAGQLQNLLPTVTGTLRATMERAADQGAYSLELGDLGQSSLRPLAAALNLSRRIDPALVRYTARVLFLSLAGVWAMKTFHLHHGYWLPLTVVVVLQPDFGATRKKAAQRLLGTLAGSLLASFILWLRLPFPAIMAATAVTSFFFGFYLRRNYGVAVVFITLFVVFLTEAHGPTTLAFTVERVADTATGGLLAVLAALVFWPIWERDRIRPILARALRTNAEYLRLMGGHLEAGRCRSPELTRTRRQAETAGAAVFSSLQRMSGDPRGFRDRMNELAAVANGNQRITRALNLIPLESPPGGPAPWARTLADPGARGLEDVAAAVDPTAPPSQALARAKNEVGAQPARPAGPAGAGPAFAQLQRALAEIGAIVIGARELANPPASAS